MRFIELPRMPSKDRGHWELVAGGWELLPSKGYFAELVATDVWHALYQFLEEHPEGRASRHCLWVFEETPLTARRPETAFVSAERWPVDEELPPEALRGYAVVVPDLIAEVVHPPGLAAHFEERRRMFLATGVREAWMVFPEGMAIDVHDDAGGCRTYAGGERLVSELVPGFEPTVEELLGDPDMPRRPTRGGAGKVQ